MTSISRRSTTPDESEDLYFLARLALWAGDISQAIIWLDELLLGRGYKLNRYPREFPEDEIGIAASRLRRQATRLRNRVDRTRPPLLPKPLPLVLSDENWFVRATVWQHDIRRFRLLVYLSDTQFENHFYKTVTKLSSQPREDAPSAANVDYTLPDKVRQTGKKRQRDTIADYSVEIVLEGNPFVEAHVSDFGTIEAEAIWTKRQLPADREMILDNLRRLPASFLRSNAAD